MEASSREIVVEAATHGVDGSGGNGVGEGTVAACIGEVDSIAGTGGSEQPVATKKCPLNFYLIANVDNKVLLYEYSNSETTDEDDVASLSDVTSSESAGNGLVSDSESSLPKSSVGTCSSG
jgi:hypothetical protein